MKATVFKTWGPYAHVRLAESGQVTRVERGALRVGDEVTLREYSARAPDVEAAPLAYALVRSGQGALPVLLGQSPDAAPGALVGLDIVDGALLEFGPQDVIGAVSTDPAAVYFGVHATLAGAYRQAAEAKVEPKPKKGEVIGRYPGLQVLAFLPFKARGRGARFQWSPERPRGLSAFPEVKPVLLQQRRFCSGSGDVPSLDNIRLCAIFAGLTVHAGTEEAEDTFSTLVGRYEAMHGAMPPVEEVEKMLARAHQGRQRVRMYETVAPWAVTVQEAMKRGLCDRPLREHLWNEVPRSEQPYQLGLAKLSFALMLMGQNLCCLDTWILGTMYAPDPGDNSPAGRERRRGVAEDISGMWKNHTPLALQRYEQVEDAFLKGNPWYVPGELLGRAQGQWTAWEWALGVPAAHRPWLEVTKRQQQRIGPFEEVPF